MTMEQTNNDIQNEQIFSGLINPRTGQPVQVGKAMSFNANTYETNAFQQRIDAQDYYNAQFNNRLLKDNQFVNNIQATSGNQSINQQALYNIPVVPDFLLEDYNEAYSAPLNWLDNLHIASEDEIEEWKAKGKIGLGEAAQKAMTLRGLAKGSRHIPFVGTTTDVAYNVDLLKSINKLKKGEEISDIEMDLLVDYLREAKEIQVRGTTLPNKTLNAIFESLPFFAEFGIGVAATPETFGGSLSVSALALSKAAGKKAARKAIQAEIKKLATQSTMTGIKKNITGATTKKLYNEAMQKYVGRIAAKAVGEVGGKEALKIVAKTTPKSIYAANFGSKPLTYMTAKNTIGGAIDRQLGGSVYVTDAGEAVFAQPENIALSIMKGFGSSIFDNYTETMGWAFAPVTSYFARPVRKVLPKKFFTQFEKLISSRYGKPAAEVLHKYGYDGVIEEMGEELLNRFLCDVFGIEGLEGYTYDGFMNNVFYKNDPEQWLVEALSFAAMGGAAHGTTGAYSKIREAIEKTGDENLMKRYTELANKSIYSPTEFYLEQGLMKIEGSQSAAEQLLRQKFAERGVDEMTMNSYFNSASELQIREELEKIMQEEYSDYDKRREKAVESVAERFGKNLKNKDYSKNAADILVRMAEHISELNPNFDMEEILERSTPEIRSYADNKIAEQNIEFENKNEVAYSQSAQYAGADESNFEDAKKEWEEKGTESKYFKKWFGDSKVVDENGKPLVVYHGTNSEFDTFSREFEGQANGRPVYGGGFNFTIYKDYSKDFGNKQMACYLSIKNPLNGETYDPEKFIEPVYKMFYGENYKDYMRDSGNWTGYIEGKLSSVYGLRDLMQGIRYKKGVDVIEFYKSLGYDGTQDGHIWVAFSPEQIKSVNNQGTFDSNNPNIYFQRKPYNNPNQMKFDFDSLMQQQATQQKLIFQPQSTTGQSVQQEIKKEYKEADIKQSKVANANNGDIVDTGDSLLGNLKKDKKQYSWEELENMNELLRKKYLTKSYIYSLPTSEELRKQGLSDRTIAFVYLVNNKINARPSKYYDDKLEYQKIYYDSVQEIMQKTIDFAKKNNDLIANYNKNSGRNKELFDSIFPDYENKNPYNVFTSYPDLNRKALIVGGNKFVDVIQLGYSTESDITKALILVDKEKAAKTQSKEKLTGWQSKFDVVETYRGWAVADKKSGMIITDKDLPSESVAKEVAQKIYDYLKEQEFSYTANYETLRDYIPRRENNQNVKPEALIEVFGFRGINFGNWTKQSERQDFLNLAYDSLHDLAEILNLPPRALSLDGKLGLAFGAQGRSGAAGHFIPEYNEINLTRKSGAGALAHEWWHALDYYFGDFALGKDFSGESALGSVKQGLLRTEIFDALKNLDEQIKYAPLTENEVEERAKLIEQGARRNIEYYAKDIKNSFAKSKNADKIAEFIDGIVNNADKIDVSTTENRVDLDSKFSALLEEKRRTWTNLGKLSNLMYQCKKLQQVKEIAAAQKTYTKYYENAKELNKYEKGHGSGYWTRNTELGARAFASYILDKMTKQKYKNNFLVRDEKGDITLNLEALGRKMAASQKGEKFDGEENIFIEHYPADSEERKRIFAAFDNLFNNIKYQKTDKGYRLYQSKISPKTSQKAREVLSALQKIANGSEEETVADLRDDLEQYGGTNDVTFIFGNDKKGIQHIAQKHGAKTLLNVFDTVVDGKIVRYVKGNKTVVIGKGNYEAVLSLDEHGNKKTWLLSGWDITKQTKKSSGVIGEVSTQANTTQIKPTFSRQDLGAELSNIITDNSENFKGGIERRFQDSDDTEDIFNSLSNDVQGNIFFDKSKSDRFIDTLNKRGAYIPVEKIIELYKNADESTFIHEMGHLYLDILTEYSQGNEALTDELNAVRKWLKNDGGDFTVEQHEKFARGFEAYLRSGYAQSNKLKKVFEYFKNFLLSIYDSLKQLDIKEDEMPQIINIFDRLLSTEKERIRATVFDKISEIDEKIEQIKENEKKEFKELDEIYKNNINLLNRQSSQNRQKEEYLELAEKITSRETKEVKEFKKRYKNATLEILEAATGKPRTWIANSKNWEVLQELLDKADDKITTGIGFQPEWREFYYDSGSSYETDEIGGDYNLAQQAFDVLTENRYEKTFDENYEFADVEKFIAKFDYLAAKVKTEKGKNKEAAYEALAEIFNNMPAMPDEVFTYLQNKFDELGEEADEQLKEDFNKKSYPSIPIVQQLQFYVTQKLNDLKVYNPETRYKMRLNKSHRLYRYIKNVRSVNTAKKEIRKINDYIIDDMRTNQRSLLHKEIQKQIKVNSKAVKVGAMKKGKFDWQTNTIFAELVELNKLTREEAERQLGALIKIQDAAKGENRDSFDSNEVAEFNKTNDFQGNLKNKFLQYRSMKLQELDVTHTIGLLQDILELKEKGRQAKSQEEFIKKTQRWNTKNNLIDLLEVTKLSGLAKYGANWVAGVGRISWASEGVLANWESMLNALFNKQTAEKYSLLYDEAKTAAYAREHILDFYKRAFDIYGFRKPNNWDKFLDYDYMQPLIKLMQEYDNEKYTYRQRVFSTNMPNNMAESDIELTRAQIITMYAWSLNDKLEQRLYTQFGLEQIREMFENRLSEQDRQLAWALIDTCETMREDINEVFINTTGLSLPKVDNYFPSKAERVQSDIDMYHDFFVKSDNPSFIKERKVCNRIPMKPMSPLDILLPHINKTARYVVMSEKVNYLNQIFKDTAIKTKMQEIWGSKDGAKIYQTLINKLAACTYTNYAKGTNLVAGWLDTVSRNYISGAIGASPKVMIGQLLSVVNYAENMPSAEWVKGFSKATRNPVEAFKYMLDNCDYLKARLSSNSQNEIMSILTHEKDKFRTLRNFMTSNTKWGDIIAIAIGGKPYVDYLMKQGMSKEDAFKKFVEDTMRAQQAGTTSSISEWQSAQARNCITRMIFAFRNTGIQYERKFFDTLIQARRGDISKGEAIKKLFIYKILNPFMFTSFLQNLSVLALISALFNGDDPDEAGGNFIKNVIESLLLSGFNSYGLAGFIAAAVLENIVSIYDKEYKHFEKDVPILTDIDKQTQKLLKGDLELVDYIDALAMFSEITMGLPASKIVNMTGGVIDTTQGNFGVGLSRIGGWGKYTATKAWTGEAPEKETKRKTSSRKRRR